VLQLVRHSDARRAGTDDDRIWSGHFLVKGMSKMNSYLGFDEELDGAIPYLQRKE
jgi:hypothetical protein